MPLILLIIDKNIDRVIPGIAFILPPGDVRRVSATSDDQSAVADTRECATQARWMGQFGEIFPGKNFFPLGLNITATTKKQECRKRGNNDLRVFQEYRVGAKKKTNVKDPRSKATFIEIAQVERGVPTALDNDVIKEA